MKNKIILYVFVFLSLGYAAYSMADTVTFQPPTEREDNSQLLPSEIQGYRVYDNSGNLITSLPAGATSFEVAPTSAEQTRYVTTLDTDGRESAYSEAAVVPKLVAKPKPPAILSVLPAGR